MAELETISWRRFAVLFRCLSPNSATVTRVSSSQYMSDGTGRRQKVSTVTGPKAAQRAFDMLFKPPAS
jgi:hypothetical protein